MKKPLLIGVSALVLLASATLLFAQTTTGSSLITQMKAATHAFTLTADLNSGATGLESAPLVGKRTGDMLGAGEWNRVLELVGQGGGTGGGGTQFGWVKPTGGTILSGVWMQWPANSGDHSPTKLCQDAGYDLAIGFCRGADGLNRPHEGTVMANTNLGYWVLTCNYGDGGKSMSANHEILCARSGAGGGSGGSGWVDVPLTDTADFDVKCDYIFNGIRASFVNTTRIGHITNEFDATTATTYRGIRKENKNIILYHQDNYANNTIYANETVTKIEKLCRG